MKKKLTSINILLLILTFWFTTLSCKQIFFDENKPYSLKTIFKISYMKPLIINSQLITIKNNIISCFDKASGINEWNYQLKNKIIATPSTDGNFIYVVTSYELVSIDLSNGKEIWRKESTDEFISEVFYYKENLYILGRERLYSIASKLENPQKTKIESVGQVHINQILDFKILVNKKITPLIFEDMLYIVIQDNISQIFSKIVGIQLDDYNMSKLWSYSANSEIISELNLDNNKIFFSTKDGKMNCLNILDGTPCFSIQH